MLSCWHLPLLSPTSCPYSESLVGMCASIRDACVVSCSQCSHTEFLFAADCKINHQDLSLTLPHCFKVNGDTVLFPRSGKVLKLPKFYVILENWVNWKIFIVLETLLVWDGAGIVLTFEHFYWNALKCKVNPVTITGIMQIIIFPPCCLFS